MDGILGVINRQSGSEGIYHLVLIVVGLTLLKTEFVSQVEGPCSKIKAVPKRGMLFNNGGEEG